MNFKTSFGVLGNLSVGIFALACTALPQESWAGGFGSIRAITSNNIYPCPTGLSWESVIGNGNMSSTSATFSMGCLNNDGTARWIIKSGYSCQERFCRSAPIRSYTYDNYDVSSGTYTRVLPTAVAGVDCQLKKSFRNSYAWVCQNLTSYKNITVKTVGNEEVLYEGTFFRRYGSFPAIQYPIVVNSARQSEILKSSRVCYGSVGYCK